MPLDMVLTGLNYIGQISIRKRLRGGGIDYLGGGLAQSCIKRFGNNEDVYKRQVLHVARLVVWRLPPLSCLARLHPLRLTKPPTHYCLRALPLRPVRPPQSTV